MADDNVYHLLQYLPAMANEVAGRDDWRTILCVLLPLS